MNITAGELCYVLSRAHNVRALYDVASENIVSEARLWRGQPMRPQTLYVIDLRHQDFAGLAPLLPRGGAVLLIGAPEGPLPSTFDRHAALPTALMAYEGPLSPDELLEEAAAALVALQAWDCSLKDAIAASTPIEQVFDLSRQQMPDLANIVDIDLNVIAGMPAEVMRGTGTSTGTSPRAQARNQAQAPIATQAPDGKWRLSDQAVEALLLDDDYSQAASKRDVFYYPYDPGRAQYICGNIFVGDECRARLVALCPRGILGFVRRGMFALFDHILRYVRQTLIASWQTTSDGAADDALHRELAHALADPSQASPERIAEASKQVGWLPEHRFCVMRLRFFRGAYWQALVAYFCGELETTVPGSRAAAYDNEIVWACDLDLLPPEERGRLADHLTHTVREYACKAGISATLDGIAQIGLGTIEARIALDLGQDADPHFWIYRFDDYRDRYVYTQATAELPVERLVHPGLLALKRYDAEHGTSYYQTLWLYYKHEFNVTEAARETYVHRTTFIRHLAAIPEIAGFDPHDSRTRTELALSFWLLAHDERGGDEGAGSGRSGGSGRLGTREPHQDR